jgi:RND family efflux transporter MFP subunit
MKTQLYKTLAVLLLFGALGCSDATKEEAMKTEEKISVKVAQVSADGDKAYLSVSGTIQASKSANLSTRVMGHVEKVNVNIGDKVIKGQLLVAINSADLRAKQAQVNAGIAEAKAAFDIAEKDYNRFKNLYEQNSASQKELDDMTAHYNMAQARYNAALEMRNEIDAQFSYTNVIAPFTGVITARFIDEGDLANPGMPLLAMEAPGNFEVIARVPETSISKIQPGLDAQISISSIGSRLKGRVEQVSSSSANTGSQYLVKISLEDSHENVRSGMFVSVNFPSVKIESAEALGAVLIPQSVVINRGGLAGIYTVSQQQTAVLRWLRLGKTIGDQVEVLSGLSAEETYILSANAKLYNGAHLDIQ